MNIAMIFKLLLILLITYIPLHASNMHIVRLGIGGTILSTGLFVGYYTQAHIVDLYRYIKNGEFNSDYQLYKMASTKVIPNRIVNKFSVAVGSIGITLLLMFIGLKMILSNL